MNPARNIPVVSVVGVIALALTVTLNAVVGVLLIQTRQSSEDYASCSARWQQEFGSAYRARIAASVEVDAAQDEVFRAVAAGDPEAFKKTLANYIKVRDKQKRERAKNPLPPLPEQLCGDPEEVRR